MPIAMRTIDVSAPQERVFAIIDAVERTPEWLQRCTRIERLDDGPLDVGSTLRYHYRDGRRTGEMAGQVVAREPVNHLTLLFTDSLMGVTVDFRTAPGATPDTTKLTHTIDIQPRGMGKLFTPVIAVTLPRQTREAMNRLKVLAEAER